MSTLFILSTIQLYHQYWSESISDIHVGPDCNIKSCFKPMSRHRSPSFLGALGLGPPAEGPGAARAVRATADRRRRGARGGGGAARTGRATAAAAVGPGGGAARTVRTTAAAAVWPVGGGVNA